MVPPPVGSGMTGVIRRLAWPVWNAAERRPRAPVRLALFAAALGLAGAGVGFALRRLPPAVRDRLLGAVPSAVVGSPGVRQAVGAVAGAGLLLALVAGAGVALDRRRLRDYGLALDRDWWLDCGFGLCLGAALLSLVFAVEYAAGWVAVRGTVRAAGPLAFPAAFAAAAALFVAVGVAEELLLRGYVLTNLAEGLGALGNRAAVVLATLASSALFGALHAGNPNATAVSTVAVGAGGVMLALGYVLTGDLAIPIGLHTTWNLFQGAVYGYPVSGMDLGVSALVTVRSGPRIATGGAFGPEAGLTGAGAMVVGSVAIAAYVRWRGGRLALAPVSVPALRWWRWARPGARDGD
ncbi:MAG: lysostaphin resistance A-like protein [Haloferacaceae archaeon]